MQNPNYTEWKATLRNGCDYFILVAGAFIAGIALISKQDKGQFSEWPTQLQPVLLWFLQNNWWFVLGLTALAAIAKIIKERLDRTWVWTAVQAIVDRIQTEAFAQQPGYAHHHRATLFRHQRCKWWPFPLRYFVDPPGKRRWPCSGWLVPAIRSGHTTQHTTTYFLAPDDADKAEGVVGHIWASNKEVALAAGTALRRNADDVAIVDYAGKTFVSATWAKHELSNDKVLAASFRGIPVEGKAGRKWGVLILDSRDPDAAMKANLNIAPYAYCLGKLLERV